MKNRIGTRENRPEDNRRWERSWWKAPGVGEKRKDKHEEEKEKNIRRTEREKIIERENQHTVFI